mmetsp:Transcript_7616/g.19098  ORF Transcript_7616/g.19098 Transcript_7616/m.19098 type:complete len:200 (-) Transcript_7616:16-615(-)
MVILLLQRVDNRGDQETCQGEGAVVLRVAANLQDLFPAPRERDRDVARRRGLADAALAVHGQLDAIALVGLHRHLHCPPTAGCPPPTRRGTAPCDSHRNCSTRQCADAEWSREATRRGLGGHRARPQREGLLWHSDSGGGGGDDTWRDGTRHDEGLPGAGETSCSSAASGKSGDAGPGRHRSAQDAGQGKNSSRKACRA